MTLTETGPALLAGIVTVISVSETNVKHAPDPHGPRSCAPTNTSVAPVSSDPVRVTVFPPSVDPESGLMVLKLAPTYVYVWSPEVPPVVTT
jgi:hypothetical protein